MAKINELGNVQTRCPGCNGALSTYEWQIKNKALATRTEPFRYGRNGSPACAEFRLYRCSGCGRGGLATLIVGADTNFPELIYALHHFEPEAKERLKLPPAVPKGLQAEFREGEQCFEAGCTRAAAAMFRSVLDKAMRASGYKLRNGTTLEQQIDLAAADGVITKARSQRAHEDVRVLGNDVLHDEWREVDAESVEVARHYVQRILEDLYDDREGVVRQLVAAGRKPVEAGDAGA